MKGENILLGSDLRPIVSDFGLSTIHEKARTDATQVVTGGSTNWMSPELLLGDVSIMTFQSDMYALGMVISEVSRCLRFESLG